MPLILPGNVASATASTGYNIDNSCRYNRPDNPDLSRTPGSDGNRQVFTVSCWVKRGALGNYEPLFASHVTFADFKSNDTFGVGLQSSGVRNLETNRVFRDCSAWYHIVVKVDTTQALAADRLRLYVNGVEETSFATDTAVVQDYESKMNWTGNSFEVLHDGGGTRTLDGYAAEFVLLDGTAAAPTEFGEFDEDSPTIWKPKDVSGLTFGTNGLYLNFSDSADLGADSSGNGNDLTVANLAAADQATDTPTNNFCTLNNLDAYYAGATFSEGNCKVVYGAAGVYPDIMPTMGVSTGKWYWEYKWPNAGASSNCGISPTSPTSASGAGSNRGSNVNEYVYMYTGLVRTAGSTSAYGDALSENAIQGTYLDLDNNKLYWSVNGVIQNSGTGYSITAAANTSSGIYFPTVGNEAEASRTIETNFGGCPSFAISSGNTDANGYGNFEYDPSDGGSASFDGSAKDFLAICTKNLGSDGG